MAMNTVCHIEYDCTNMDRTQKFYETLFGWTFREFMPEMRVFGIGDQHIGGLLLVDKVDLGSSPCIWFEVDDLTAAGGRAKSGGGTWASEIKPVPGVGHSTVVEDPDGNRVGLVKFERE